MHLDDLSHDTYLGHCPYLKSIGWLGAGYEFVTGDPPANLVALLEEHLEDHWCCFACAGSHSCEFCQAEGSEHRDARNFIVPAKDTAYLAPGMILHYVQQHRYLPPSEFIEALRNCPPRRSDRFMILLEDFGRWLESQAPPVGAAPS
jgi:hypothetical protein